jgi:hypothetical protein
MRMAKARSQVWRVSWRCSRYSMASSSYCSSQEAHILIWFQGVSSLQRVTSFFKLYRLFDFKTLAIFTGLHSSFCRFVHVWSFCHHMQLSNKFDLSFCNVITVSRRNIFDHLTEKHLHRPLSLFIEQHLGWSLNFFFLSIGCCM